jgi:hypothetical protein
MTPRSCCTPFAPLGVAHRREWMGGQGVGWPTAGSNRRAPSAAREQRLGPRQATTAAVPEPLRAGNRRTGERLMTVLRRSAFLLGRGHRPQRTEGVQRVLEQEAKLRVTFHHQHAIEEQAIGIVQAASQPPPA